MQLPNTQLISSNPIFGESSRFYRIFRTGPYRVAFSNGYLWIESSNQNPETKIRAELVTSVVVVKSWFWSSLSIQCESGEKFAIGGLPHRIAAGLREALLADSEVLKAMIAEARMRALTIGNELQKIEGEVDRLFSGDSYVRHSASVAQHSRITSVLGRCSAYVQEHLDSGALRSLHRFQRWETAERFEHERNRVNQRYINRVVGLVKAAARNNFVQRLTDEQAIAIATDEDSTLVLAGAGTGKTSVILGKIAHLVEDRDVSPEEILVLAFNTAAAAEIRDRLPKRFKGTKVRTFHAFGMGVIAQNGVAPSISKLAEDPRLMENTVNQWFRELSSEPQQADDITEFVAYNLVPDSSPFDFESAGEYYDFVRTWELRTFSGDRVKSLEELRIANFLSLNGIEFKYEEPYSVNTATRRHRQYEPDFYLPEHKIYIEHFALNRNGQAPKGWDDYGKGVEWKRSIHQKNRTTLVETYSWQHSDGSFRNTLRENLESHGVKFRSVPIQTLLQKLAEWVVTWLSRLLVKFLNHVKTNDISAVELRRRANSGIRNIRQSSFLNLFEKIRNHYEAALENERALDFHDLINRAADLIRSGRSPASYRYVLVDEFQDISAGRMGLLRALNSRETAYYLVGDDWQSIYRFADSDVSLMRNCDQHLGYTQSRQLTQTFRYGRGILDPASQFVRKNPIQTQREMKPAVGEVDHGISIIANDDEKNGLQIALKDITERIDAVKQSASGCSVLVLGRYRRFNNLDPSLSRQAHGKFKVRYSTIHSAKGQEADYVVVVGLNSGRLGFPCKIEDDPLLHLVMPPTEDSELRFSEERRLFYVAITRARRGAYLVVDPDRPSEFVTELLARQKFQQLGEREIDDALRPSCPRCGTGKLKSSQSGDNLRCTNHPSCTHLAPKCGSCGKGFTVNSGSGTSTCTNAGCSNPASACPRCSTGVLHQRNGSYGTFWGCTNYWSEPPCEFTRNSNAYAARSRV